MTINDIASMAGVSKATVSRFLNGGYVSSEKRDLISKVIEETGFEPNSQARTLRTKKTGLIGVIIPKISSESISRMVEGISTEFYKTGYKLLLADTANDEMEELFYLKTLTKYSVDGIILLGTVISSAHKKVMKECKIPLVILAQQVSGQACVYFNDYEVMKDLTDLVDTTSKNIAYIGVNKKDKAAGLDRYNGFIEVVEDKDINTESKITNKITDFLMESGKKACQEILKENTNIDTIVCATDNLAVGAMEYIKSIGKRIPEDIQIVGMGDSTIGNIISPKLTTVHFPYKTAGMEAAKMLVRLIQGKDISTMEMKINGNIISRESTR